jgi:hypothetical protein
MIVTSLSKRNGAKFYDSIGANEFDSRLEVPNGKDPSQNAWLTITVNYTLNFVDSKNQVPGLIVNQAGKFYAKPSNPKANMCPIKDWDLASRSDFVKRFAKAESFWNYRFLLITPQDYDAFDFTSWAGPGWICRPNVICLFRLKSGGSPNHLPINVVRAEGDFRSNKTTYDDGDVKDKTVWHELGHALDQLHIRALLGDAFCSVPANVNEDICYKEPPGVAPNIQGTGTGLLPQNAKAWHELIARHTETPQARWRVSMATNMPPRKLQMAFQVRGVMPKNW